jgi:molybdopterin synthase sulfur carrier subunit
MNIKVLYFASLRDALGCAEESMELPSQIRTVGDLRTFLTGRGENWCALGEGRNVRVARNQKMAKVGEVVAPGDEIAFFPPVTGG